MFMLVDCDNFFVSCERIFQPALKDRPVVVLSNNDGCVVSRSYEAKALKIPMGCPFFKIEKSFKNQNGIALSSNYELYADISKRIMAFLEYHFPHIEIYSIDEAFIRLGNTENLEETAAFVRNEILRQIGISVSVGIAASKTLAKIAAAMAKSKKEDKWQILTDDSIINHRLSGLKVVDIWGVGRRCAGRLNFLGIFTALDLKRAPLKLLRSNFGIPMEKTAMELNGYACLEIEPDAPQQTIITSRSFEFEISDLCKLKQIIAEFTDNACLRLRRQNSKAGGIVTLLQTNRFHHNLPQYNNQCLTTLPRPSNYTAAFIAAAQQGLEQIYRPEYHYKRAGVMLIDICSLNRPSDFFADTAAEQKEQKLMTAIDTLNHKLGKKTVFFAAQAAGVRHYIKREFRSGSFTTSWDGLALVK